MTALARTDVPGLAIRLPNGDWFPPPVIPGDIPGEPREHHAALVE